MPAGPASPARALAELKLHDRVGVMVFAVRRPDGHHVFNPTAGYRVDAGDVLIGCAGPEQLGAARKLLAEGGP